LKGDKATPRRKPAPEILSKTSPRVVAEKTGLEVGQTGQGQCRIESGSRVGGERNRGEVKKTTISA